LLLMVLSADAADQGGQLRGAHRCLLDADVGRIQAA
jgi:hypothetical protein